MDLNGFTSSVLSLTHAAIHETSYSASLQTKTSTGGQSLSSGVLRCGNSKPCSGKRLFFPTLSLVLQHSRPLLPVLKKQVVVRFWEGNSFLRSDLDLFPFSLFHPSQRRFFLAWGFPFRWSRRVAFLPHRHGLKSPGTSVLQKNNKTSSFFNKKKGLGYLLVPSQSQQATSFYLFFKKNNFKTVQADRESGFSPAVTVKNLPEDPCTKKIFLVQ